MAKLQFGNHSLMSLRDKKNQYRTISLTSCGTLFLSKNSIPEEKYFPSFVVPNAQIRPPVFSSNVSEKLPFSRL